MSLLLGAATALMGLMNKAKADGERRRYEAEAANASRRNIALAEETAREDSVWRAQMTAWVNQMREEGAFDASGQIERGKQEIADYERRNMSGINSARRSGGYSADDTVIQDERDRVAITTRENLMRLGPELERAARAEELAFRTATAPRTEGAQIALAAGGQAFGQNLALADRAEARGGNPYALLANLMPLLEGSKKDKETVAV